MKTGCVFRARNRIAALGFDPSGFRRLIRSASQVATASASCSIVCSNTTSTGKSDAAGPGARRETEESGSAANGATTAFATSRIRCPLRQLVDSENRCARPAANWCVNPVRFDALAPRHP